MQLKDARESYYTNSGKVSELGRQLAFAGLAVVWIFKIDTPNGSKVAVEWWGPSIAFIVALMLDLLQYVVATVLWGVYHRRKEREFGVGNQREFAAPASLNWPALFFFWFKTMAVLVGGSWLLTVLVTKLLS